MDPNVYQYLTKHPHLLEYVRQFPIWYRYLSRDPEVITEMEKAEKDFKGKTFSKRIEKMSDQVQMISMIMQLANAMKD